MITIKPETVAEARGDIEPLLVKHYEELTVGKHVVKLNVDWGKYERLEKSGLLATLVARDDGRMVGYAVFFIASHIHYKDLITASNDVLFLEKEYRTSSRCGLGLIRESEKHLTSLGVQKIMWHVKTSLDWSAILIHLGYGKEEVVLGKLLGEDHGI